mmetsp:Transcript_124370/g.398297  ORF Transcript_124370/g.398297 Transcript_124370/m.398297 type:complete len:382 (+) Transcript_124370:161-1306(+)
MMAVSCTIDGPLLSAPRFDVASLDGGCRARSWTSVSTTCSRLEDRTMFRSWTTQSSTTCGSSDCGPEEGPVEGLRRALTEVGLASYIATAEAWCQEVGAAFLAEVAEEHEAFCDDLGLGELQRRPLRQVIGVTEAASVAWCNRHGDFAATSASCRRPSALVRSERFVGTKLDVLRQDAMSYGEIIADNVGHCAHVHLIRCRDSMLMPTSGASQEGSIGELEIPGQHVGSTELKVETVGTCSKLLLLQRRDSSLTSASLASWEKSISNLEPQHQHVGEESGGLLAVRAVHECQHRFDLFERSRCSLRRAEGLAHLVVQPRSFGPPSMHLRIVRHPIWLAWALCRCFGSGNLVYSLPRRAERFVLASMLAWRLRSAPAVPHQR